VRNALQMLLQAPDQFDQLTVLVVDLFDADTEFFSPLQHAHRKSKPPFSALNVIVR
jgi:hypothetical protein